MALRICDTADEIQALETHGGLRGAEQRFAEHRADLHLAWIEGDRVTAQCSLWWTRVPAHAEGRVGLVGHFHAMDVSAVAMLQNATAELMRQGCTIAIGPMDGSTWHSYRLVTDAGTEPAFFLEPQNPPEWTAHFENAGFAPLAQYYSGLNENLAFEDARIPAIQARFNEQGVTIRHSDQQALPVDLENIFAVSVKAFATNFLYSPMSKEAFLEQYQRVMPYVDPRLVFVAERGAEAVGFLFAIPDLLQRQRGQAVDTAIIKTLAILPEPSLRGLGSWLVDHLHHGAHELGYRRCIHALMHKDNTSLRMSRHFGNIMRRYTLYARILRA